MKQCRTIKKMLEEQFACEFNVERADPKYNAGKLYVEHPKKKLKDPVFLGELKTFCEAHKKTWMLPNYFNNAEVQISKTRFSDD